MVQMGDVCIGDGRPKICASIMERDRKSIIAAADLLLQKQIDIVEWRIDHYQDMGQWDLACDTLRRLKMSLYGKPLLVTLRTQEEGNRMIGPEDYRNVLEKIAGSGYADMVDVEIFQDLSYGGNARSADAEYQRAQQGMIGKLKKWIGRLRDKTVVMGSYHNYEMTPGNEELVWRLEIMEKVGVDVMRFALMPRDRMDVLRLMVFTLSASERLGKPLATMSMGKLGSISRMSGEAFGSAMTFASIGQGNVPGQIPVHRLGELLDVIHQYYQ